MSERSNYSPIDDSSIQHGETVPCTICRLHNSTVTYFNVTICSSCRAFFRRSVKSAKKYYCLNNRLCGKDNLVPNRRVCKYCRFTRCVDAGMLNAKLKLQNRLIETAKLKINNPISLTAEPRKDIQLHKISSSVISTQIPSILSRFCHFRRQIQFERLRLYGNLKPRISSNAKYDMHVGLNEYNLFNKIVSSTENIFNEIDSNDWHILNTQEYSLWWSICEQILCTIQNRGHETKRIYNFDGSYTPLNEDYTRRHWSFIYSLIYGNRDAIFNATIDYMFHVQMIMCNNVGTQFAKAKLDETEISALLLLLMTRHSYNESVKSQTRTYLQWLRNQTLKSLAIYLKETSQNVDERMGEIIFLMTDFQNLGRLIQHSMRLLISATDYRIVPNEFFQQLKRSPTFLRRE